MHCPVEIHQLLNEPLTTHSWNGQRNKIAVATTGESIFIFKREGTKWVKECELKAHELQVTGLDWSAKTDRLLSCSMDRNVYVWAPDNKQQQQQWKPTLVALNFSKAVTCVCWSPKGDKFAAATADGSIAIAYYDADNDWWIGKLAKQPLKHTITALKWHPNNLRLLCGCIDGHVAAFSGIIKAVDGAEDDSTEDFTFKSSTPVMDVSFSPSGKQIAWTNHDGSCTIASSAHEQETIQAADWPMIQIQFISEKLIVCTGHSYDPVLIGFKDGKWSKLDSLVAKQNEMRKSSSTTGFNSAMAKFKSLDDCGLEEVKSASKNRTGHYNTVNKVSVLADASGKAQHLATSSLDGNLIIWNVNEVMANSDLSQLTL